MAGVDGNRTHRGLIRPTTGFEVQERHQAASYSHNRRSSILSRFIVSREMSKNKAGLAANEACSFSPAGNGQLCRSQGKALLPFSGLS